jgi:hypothetical protein
MITPLRGFNFSPSIGASNTAAGSQSLFFNTTGGDNTGVGSASLRSNTTGNNNSGIGSLSLTANTTGSNNTASGVQSLLLNVDGSSNTAIGRNALSATPHSSNNTAIGFDAAFAFNLGNDNTFVGTGADASADGITNSVAIGKDARTTGDNQVRFGNAFTTSIGGIVGFTNLSDGRYKRNIGQEVKGLDFILKLRPVTYQMDIAELNRKLNPAAKTDELTEKRIHEISKTIFSGFIAQEVEQAAKDASYDFSGVDKPKNKNDFYGLRYAEFVVPLVKAVQEQQKIITEQQQTTRGQQQMIEELKKSNSEQKNTIEDLIKRIEKLEADRKS